MKKERKRERKSDREGDREKEFQKERGTEREREREREKDRKRVCELEGRDIFFHNFASFHFCFRPPEGIPGLSFVEDQI